MNARCVANSLRVWGREARSNRLLEWMLYVRGAAFDGDYALHPATSRAEGETAVRLKRLGVGVSATRGAAGLKSVFPGEASRQLVDRVAAVASVR
jgi:hypothetical protein